MGSNFILPFTRDYFDLEEPDKNRIIFTSYKKYIKDIKGGGLSNKDAFYNGVYYKNNRMRIYKKYINPTFSLNERELFKQVGYQNLTPIDVLKYNIIEINEEIEIERQMLDAALDAALHAYIEHDEQEPECINDSNCPPNQYCSRFQVGEGEERTHAGVCIKRSTATERARGRDYDFALLRDEDEEAEAARIRMYT